MDLDEFDLRYTLAADQNRLDFGVNYRATEVYVKGVTTQQDLGSWGVSNPRDVELYAPGVVEAFCMACRFSDYPVGQADVAFKGDATKLFSLLTPVYTARGNAVTTSSNENWVKEDILAAYAQFGMDNEFFGRPVHINGGLRYERTTVDSKALQTVPSRILWTADNDFLIQYSGALQEVAGDGEYNHLLPNLDVRVDVTEDVVARVSYSKTIGRVPYANLFASTTAGAPNNPTALGGQTGGNSQDPNLLPLESENFDVSVEWYYAKDSYVSVGWFDKTVKNFLGTGVFTRPLFGLTDASSGAAGTRSGSALAELDRLAVDRSPANLFTMVALMDVNNGSLAAASSTFQANLVNGQLPQSYVDLILGQRDVAPNGADPLMQFRVTQPINDREGNVFGWEFAVQHFFGDSGFGAAASYTIVNGDVDADPGQDPNENQFALVGLSDTANGTVMYEKYGISAHLSYNWRDTFLSGTNQGGSRSPQFTEAFGQWDASVSYEFNDHLQMVVEGINLTGTNHREYRRKEGMTIWAYELAPRYSIGARYRF
jgi:TonB-dependent receptor